MTGSHAVSSFKTWIFDKSSHMSSKIWPLLNKKPGGFFFSFLKRLIWGMNSSKYIIRLWHVQSLHLFSVINPVFYWHATGMLEGISSALNPSSKFYFFVINFQCNLWQKLRGGFVGGEQKSESRSAFLDRPLVPIASMVSSFIYVWGQRT